MVNFLKPSDFCNIRVYSTVLAMEAKMLLGCSGNR